MFKPINKFILIIATIFFAFYANADARLAQSGSTEATVLYNFTKSNDNGYYPYRLIQANDGNFYGTTKNGGSNGSGTVFKITPNGTETVLYSFASGTTDGATPFAGLIQANDGNFYGTTYAGGSNGNGTVFKITPAGVETVLYSFAGGAADGANPMAGVIQASDGNFYGTTTFGGSNGHGTVFKVTPTGTETVLHSFAGGTVIGDGVIYGLIQANDGNLYGTTNGGGHGYGFVFKINLSGTSYEVLYNFTSSLGTTSAKLFQGRDGNLYGTASYGNDAVYGCYGEVFKITLSGIESVVYHFTGGANDGAFPQSSLIQDSEGNFYGTTFGGGSNGVGTVFEITSDGIETVLYSFSNPTTTAYAQVNPSSLIQASDGNLYGTTANGGTTNVGTVFEINSQITSNIVSK